MAKLRPIFLLLLCMVLSIVIVATPYSYAHLEHSPHYNGGGQGMSKYYVYEGLDPEYAKPDQPTKIIFSIQDYFQNDIHDIESMVEIYAADTGHRIAAFPWTKHDLGDFEVDYSFPSQGTYQIVLSVAEATANNHGIDPPRNLLTSNSDCNCERVIFNIAISQNIGEVFLITWGVSISGGIIVLGVVLAQNYKNRKRQGLYQDSKNKEVLKYVIMLTALAAGMVHLAIYDEHSSLNIYYSIFLLLAALGQIAFGILYVSVTITNKYTYGQTQKSDTSYYKKTVLINLIGLVGTGILLGLYAYSAIFPPPLSPNNLPENVDYAGLLSKSIEAFMLVGILFLMKWEKRKFQNSLGINNLAIK